VLVADAIEESCESIIIIIIIIFDNILILAFLVFNPEDLYYLGIKKLKIIIIITTTMFMVLSSWSKSLRGFTRFT